MKKLIKKKDGSSDSSRDALFGGGGRSNNSNPNLNPYAANAPTNDPYMNNGSGAPPPPYSGGPGPGMDRMRPEKSAVPPGGYGGGPPDRFGGGGGNRLGGGPDRFGGGPPGGPPDNQNRFGAPPGGDRFGPGNYGNAGGFGQDRYGGQQEAPGSRYGVGGYGNFGNSHAPDNSAARDQLFAGARADARPMPSGGPGAPGIGQHSNWESGRGDNYGNDGGYEAYGDRQLTAEEQEEEDISAAKQEIRFLKQQDVASTRNALRAAAMAEETGRSTLERLGAQGESLHNTERNLDLASNQNRLAAEKARELKTLNRSMFAVHVSNPFTSTRRIKEREQKVLDEARRDRDEREAVRNAAWGTASRQQEVAKDMERMSRGQTKTKANLAERAKYQFEADSEDEAMENEIDQNLDHLHGAAKRLNHLAGAMGREVDVQNKHLDRIGGTVDRVDDEIALNRSRLDRIK